MTINYRKFRLDDIRLTPSVLNMIVFDMEYFLDKAVVTTDAQFHIQKEITKTLGQAMLREFDTTDELKERIVSLLNEKYYPDKLAIKEENPTVDFEDKTAEFMEILIDKFRFTYTQAKGIVSYDTISLEAFMELAQSVFDNAQDQLREELLEKAMKKFVK